MNIKKFAESYRLRTSMDADGTTIISGTSGHIYENGDGNFGTVFMSEKFRSREAWNNRRKECLAVGMELHQDGDYEGTLIFDPSNVKQAKTAIKVSGTRPKRIISPEHLAKMRAGLNASVLSA